MAGGGFVNTGEVKNYTGKVTLLVVFIAAAMGGLIFGYDIGIFGGVTSMKPFLKRFFPSVYWKMKADSNQNQYCKFHSQLLTTCTSSFYVAGLIASFFALAVTRVLGLKPFMLFGGLAFLVENRSC